MKTLFLLRHAKSSRRDPSLEDRDRPLAERGREAVPRIATYLRANGVRPEQVLCSAAARARETWQLIAQVLVPTPEVELRQDLYNAEADTILSMLRGRSDALSSVMVIGHNPAIETLARRLASNADSESYRAMCAKFPTAALAEFAFDIESWAELHEGRGELARFVQPKDLA